MLMTINASHDVVPAGNYHAIFKGVSQIETVKGKAWRWQFADDTGRQISGLSDAESGPTTRNKTGRWLAALSGKPLTPGTSVNPDDYVGKRYLVIVVAGDNGSAAINTFTPIA